MTSRIAESHIEEHTLKLLRGLGYTTLYGPDLDPDQPGAERKNWNDVVLRDRFISAITRLNPDIPVDAQEEAIRTVLHPDSPSTVINNQRFHRILTDGAEVEYRRGDSTIKGDRVKIIDYENPDNNDWLVLNQFTVIEGRNHRRPDIVVFVNGIPLVVIELKNPADEKATVKSAFNQIQTYKNQIASLFVYNEMVIISDGLDARAGTLTSDYERYMPWKTIDGDHLAPATVPQLDVLIKGICEKGRLLELMRHFLVFEDDKSGSPQKKMAGYHQYHAVRKAVETTIHATRPEGDRRAGVVWHTQGSGKSLTMVFFSGKIVLEPALQNPTIVVLTDRNDLDDQLFGTFSRCNEILRQKPVQAQDRPDLQKLLGVASGGIIFTTIQKFFPEKKGEKYPVLSQRKNIIVIADEAHRSQYDFIDGFARHIRDALPKATFIGFTGTPIELTDKNTRNVFGDYISIYDIQRAVEDGATVPIYYESRLAKIELNQTARPHIDPDFEEVTEGQESEWKETLKTKWAALEAVVGTEKRINRIAQDLVDHFEKRQDLQGKAMVVCMSRRICVELYDAIRKIRPDWHSNDDATGLMKIVMTGAATDEKAWQKHIRNKTGREEMAKKFKDSDDPFKLAIVRDMWLTGFDVPSLHTMYIDKPMRGHTLMQAIARVNRVFRDKPGGLVVDYIGLGEELREAIANYTQNKGTGEPVIDQEKAVKVMQEKYEICCGIFHGFDWSGWVDPGERLSILAQAQNLILETEDKKKRYLKAVDELSKAFALSVPHIDAISIRDDVAFFQAVRAAIVKLYETEHEGQRQWEMEHAIRQIVSNAIVTDKVIDIFSIAGLNKPDISILSEQFLTDIRRMPQKNLAAELLRKLLNDEIQSRSKKRLVQSRSFAELLEKTIKKYHNRAIDTVEVIEELIKLAKEMRDADRKGEVTGLTEAELAFYEALEVNDSAVKILGNEILKSIAQELVKTVRNNISIDWEVRETARARMRVMIKRILKKYGYPPDKQEKATSTVLQQAEMICKEVLA